MTSVSSRPVARLTTPADVVATVPSLCGFVPQDSVVVLSLRGPRRRLGLTVRLDLPPPAHRDDVAAALADRVVQDGGSAAVLVVYAQAPEPALVDVVVGACTARRLRVVEALHVDGGRWTSYLCSGPCCPADGSPVPEPPALVAAERALDGRAVLASRDELVRSLAPPDADGPWRAAVAAAQASSPTGTAVLVAVREALDVVARGGALDAAAAARVAVGLHDVRVRDEVATWALEDADAVLALAEQVARQVGPPSDAPVCTLLAWVAYVRGDGARVNVALERALRADPGYSLALLLEAALDGALPPGEVRRTLEATAQALRRGSW